MIDEKIFVPRILLCGDREYFFSRVDRRPFELVGQVEFFGVDGNDLLREGKFLLDGKLAALSELDKMIREGVFDFIVFNNVTDIYKVGNFLYQLGCPRSQFFTLREFNHLPLDGFYDMDSDNQLLMILKNLSIKTLLDADAHFVKSQLFTKGVNNLTEIDCICSEKILQIKENLFRRVYKNFSECSLRRYDTVLINEKSPADFDNALSMLEHSADLVITFVRNGSPLDAHIKKFPCDIIRAEAYQSFAGAWFFCYRRKPPEDFAMYVVTHKKLSTEHVQSFPAGYKVIHAGRALGEDLGYLGDDTGDNISELNPFLNEITALYWMWKNTSHTIVGLSHYRRFFVADGKNFLTAEEAADILKDYDIITDKLFDNWAPSSEFLHYLYDKEIVSLVENIIRKNLMRAQPDYLDVFNLKMNSPTLYKCNMFVARRPVFEAYCEWLFSFILDAFNEVFRKVPLQNFPAYPRRLVAFFCERMFTVWLMKNNLRIKEINVVQVPGL